MKHISILALSDATMSCIDSSYQILKRKSQQPFIIFIGQKQHGDADVLKAQEYIEANALEVLNINAFRKIFRKHTNLSPLEYRKKNA